MRTARRVAVAAALSAGAWAACAAGAAGAAGAASRPALFELAPVVGTEAEQFIRDGKAPARFADYRPRLSLRSGDWKTANGGLFGETKLGRRFDILDGDRLVAFFESSWAKGVGRGQIHVVEMNPLKPWNPGGFRGTFAGLPDGAAARWCRITLTPWYGETTRAKQDYDIATDGRCVTIVNRLAHVEPEAKSLSVAVLRVDPTCGYVLDFYWQFEAPRPDFDSIRDEKRRNKMKFRFEKSGISYEFCNVMPNFLGFHLTKPRMDWRYEWLFWSQVGREGLTAAYNDFPLSNQFKFVCPIRSGGLVGFAADNDRWSQVLSRRAGPGVAMDNDTCNVLLDQHNKLAIQRPDADGLYHAKVWGRYMNLPPEATDVLLRTVEQNVAGPLLRVPVGAAMDFEKPQAAGIVGPAWRGLETADTAARSGKRSLHIPYDKRAAARPRTIFVQPAPPLEAGRRYRLEAWVKGRGEGSQVRLLLRPSHWTPRDWQGPPLAPTATEPLPAAGDWRRVALDIAMPESHGRSPWLYMEVTVPQADGAIWIDDVSLSPLPAGGAKP